MSSPRRPSARARVRVSAAARTLLGGVACAAALLLCGCATGHPRPIPSAELTEAQTFPYFRTYWVGPSFEGSALAAADGLRNYIQRIGDSVYYGDCVQSKGIFGGGSCVLPLQVTTVLYRLHSNKPLGPQRNTLIRGVPATIYDGGRNIELYSGRVAIDVFSNTNARAVAAANKLLPLNASGSSRAPLPPPIYCPGLSGASTAQLAHVIASLPGHPCQRAVAALASAPALNG
jgi:hypothetical protein